MPSSLSKFSTGCFLGFLLASSTAQALPSMIYFNNHTQLALDATVAGRPGKPIPANVTRHAVPYMGVYVACMYAGKQNSCPIEFITQKGGQRVATVTLNANNAAVLGAPTLYPPYLGQYSVAGWQTQPLDTITITYTGP